MLNTFFFIVCNSYSIPSPYCYFVTICNVQIFGGRKRSLYTYQWAALDLTLPYICIVLRETTRRVPQNGDASIETTFVSFSMILLSDAFALPMVPALKSYKPIAHNVLTARQPRATTDFGSSCRQKRHAKQGISQIDFFKILRHCKLAPTSCSEPRIFRLVPRTI